MQAIYAAIVLVCGLGAEPLFPVFQAGEAPRFGVFDVQEVSGQASQGAVLFPVFAVEDQAAQRKRAKWKIVVHGRLQSCAPCKRMHLDWLQLTAEERRRLPFELEFSNSVPSSVRTTPIAAWQTRDGTTHWVVGYHSINQLRGQFEATIAASQGAAEGGPPPPSTGSSRGG